MNWALVLLLLGLAAIGIFAVRQVRERQAIHDLVDQIAAFQGQERVETNLKASQIGDQVAGKLPVTALSTWQSHFEWAQRGGHYEGQSFGWVVFMALACGLAGGVVLLIKPAPVAFIVPVLTFIFPFLGLRTRANQVRRQAERAIPEAATLIAAELASGVSVDQAVERATQLPGPLTALLGSALEKTTDTGRPLFSRADVQGTLKESCQAAGLPVLLAFATQLDLVAEKGVAGSTLMSEIARSLAREYRERVVKDVETLDNRLTQAVALFYFAPEILLILGSFFSAILDAI
jgi:Flp pilus assembly protein TadB